jgi:putative transposase
VDRPKHGGARPGAGRKKTVKRGGPHRARPVLAPGHSAHVVLRVRSDVPRLRQSCMYRAIRRVLARYVEGAEFRVAQISIQHNHLHLIVEATDARALTWGMRSFAINAARAINAASRGRDGAVFVGRYHATQIRTARQARNALGYVMNNWRRHREDLVDRRCMSASLDPYSSAISFTGWTKRFRIPEGYVPLPVSPPRSALLRAGWMQHGRLDPWAKPGPVW